MHPSGTMSDMSRPSTPTQLPEGSQDNAPTASVSPPARSASMGPAAGIAGTAASDVHPQAAQLHPQTQAFAFMQPQPQPQPQPSYTSAYAYMQQQPPQYAAPAPYPYAASSYAYATPYNRSAAAPAPAPAAVLSNMQEALNRFARISSLFEEVLRHLHMLFDALFGLGYTLGAVRHETALWFTVKSGPVAFAARVLRKLLSVWRLLCLFFLSPMAGRFSPVALALRVLGLVPDDHSFDVTLADLTSSLTGRDTASDGASAD